MSGLYFQIPVSKIPDDPDELIHGQSSRNLAGTEAIVSCEDADMVDTLRAIAGVTEHTHTEARTLRHLWDESFPELF